MKKRYFLLLFIFAASFVKAQPTIYINLHGVIDYTVDVKTVFVDPGYEAKDSAGNDYTSSVVVTGTVNMNLIGTYISTYSISANVGKASPQKRYVHVVDRIAPVINLLGANPYYHPQHQQYVDPGITIIDNYYNEAQLLPLLVIDTLKLDNLGSYKVTYKLTDPSGNVANSVSRLVIIQYLGINEIKNSLNFNVYPNPVSDFIYIENKEPNCEMQSLKILDITGKQVFSQNVTKEKITDYKLDIGKLENGIYLLQIETNEGIYLKKILVRR
ncbi:MAG: immunoglobulin-like domain-containing protein [Bacteroidota bacterium]